MFDEKHAQYISDFIQQTKAPTSSTEPAPAPPSAPADDHPQETSDKKKSKRVSEIMLSVVT